MHKCIHICIAVLLVLSALTGCTPASESPDDTTGGTQAVPGEVTIAENGAYHYTLIRPDECPDSVTGVCLGIRNRFNEMFGSMPVVTTDWSVPGKEPAADACEILIGNTSRDDSGASERELGWGDYTVRITGNNKIVITAHDIAGLSAAAEYFRSSLSLITADDGVSKLVYTGGSYTYRAGETYLFDGGYSPADFVIVYSENAGGKTAAEALASAAKKAFGTEMPVVPDTAAEQECEIIIGDTSRKSDDSMYSGENAPASYEYITAAVGHKLFIGGTGASATSSAVTQFISLHIKNKTAGAMNVPTGTVVKRVYFEGGEDNTLESGADTRIMSFNILSEEWDSAAVMEGRDTRVAATIMYYQPDVAGLQEVSQLWYSRLGESIADTYTFVGMYNTNNQYNYTALIYNKKTVKLIDNGMIIFSVGNSDRLRLLNWGLFESTATGKRYIVTNTHWDPNLSGINHSSQRQIQAQEMAQEINRLRTKYNVPVFCTGDYNCNENSEAFRSFCSDTGFTDSKSTAEVIVRACKTSHTLGKAVSTSAAESIDHITHSPDVKVLYYNTVVSDYVIKASDHCPIYIDFRLSD